MTNTGAQRPWYARNVYSHDTDLRVNNLIHDDSIAPRFFWYRFLVRVDAQLLMISPDVMENIASIRAFVLKLSANNVQV